MVDLSEDDRDPETGQVVPCVVCGMGPQRGGTGCCSQKCIDALAEAYPQHSAAAIAAYPYGQGGRSLDNDRAAYDRGVAETQQGHLTATREGLYLAMLGIIAVQFHGQWCPVWLNRRVESATPDRLLSCDCWQGRQTYERADAILAAGIIHEAGKPVVDVEVFAQWLSDSIIGIGKGLARIIAREAIAPDGPLRDECEVKAEALDEGAEHEYPGGQLWPGVRALLHKRAAEYRAGRA